MRTLFATLGLLVSLPLLAGEAEFSAAIVALQSPESALIDVRSADEFAAGALPAPSRSTMSRSPAVSAPSPPTRTRRSSSTAAAAAAPASPKKPCAPWATAT